MNDGQKYQAAILVDDALAIGEGDPRLAAVALINAAIGLLASCPDPLPDWPARTAAYVDLLARNAQAGKRGGGA